MNKILLTKFDDYLREYPGDEVRSDDDAMSMCVGIHETCCGWVDLRMTSKTHDALVCRACKLRVVFPNKITTFGDLRRHLESAIEGCS